jgi:hypothetical protein
VLGVTRSTRIAVAVGVCLLGALVAVSSAGGNHAPAWPDFPEFSDPYTKKPDSCGTTQVDPINVEFIGDQAGVPNTSSQIQWHAGWSAHNGSDQMLRVATNGGGYDCHQEYEQNASNSGVGSGRFHIRLWLIPDSLNAPDKKTVGDAHHEDFICRDFACTDPCHAVDENGPTGSGFDWGRREIRDHFDSGGHNTSSEYWGNTRNIAQCDANHPNARRRCSSGAATSDFCDGWAGSNGTAVIIHIGHDGNQ